MIAFEASQSDTWYLLIDDVDTHSDGVSSVNVSDLIASALSSLTNESHSSHPASPFPPPPSLPHQDPPSPEVQEPHYPTSH